MASIAVNLRRFGLRREVQRHAAFRMDGNLPHEDKISRARKRCRGCRLATAVQDVAATPRLNFSRHEILLRHADLRISLRAVRTRQRNPRPLRRLAGNEMPALRLIQTGQEVFHLRVSGSRRKTYGQETEKWRSRLRSRLRVSLKVGMPRCGVPARSGGRNERKRARIFLSIRSIA